MQNKKMQSRLSSIIQVVF